MSISEQELPAVQPPADGMSWAWLADQMRFYGQNFHPPQHLRGLSLAHVEAKAREEERVARAIREARESAARIAAAPKSIERALLDGPPMLPRSAMQPLHRAWLPELVRWPLAKKLPLFHSVQSIQLAPALEVPTLTTSTKGTMDT